MKQYRLGFHYHTLACSPGGEAICVPGYVGVFLDSLAEHFESITCFLHSGLPGEAEEMDYTIRSANITLVDLGRRSSVPRRTLSANAITAPLRSRCKDLDLMLIRGPSPLLPAMANACQGLPSVLLLVGDYVAGIDGLPQPVWRKELIRAWACWNKVQQLRVAKRSLTFVNSRKLYDELKSRVPELAETWTTTLNATDFYTRADTCQKRPIHLLYTGRMDRSKGLADMTTALGMLVEQGYDACLDLVGWQEAGDPILAEIKADAERLGIAERVIDHGFKPLGEELFAFYKKTDIYLIASRLSEGFPRTIWEAMAHSLPVAATRVGSIPAFIEGAAELVEPGNPEKLAEGIRRLIDDGVHRRELMRRGLALARENTLEVQSAEMAKRIREWMDTRRQ